ncbi:NrdH-redoxin [Brevibacterium sp. 5221]|uniref:NrdH-redoxin n=1 Tax=Brevibacterium rongguiense TaxID=2695267 RepID=A0A6N9H9P9_9MICO|nr:glutaredoxin domain-containing protein [Brevibacterium rongguiense]MYM20466.1 NrdH-redoxin [Brevibacterium rongguiense]
MNTNPTATVYVTTNCTACTATKRQLDKLDADIEYIAADSDEVIAKLKDLGFRQLPVVITESGSSQLSV